MAPHLSHHRQGVAGGERMHSDHIKGQEPGKNTDTVLSLGNLTRSTVDLGLSGSWNIIRKLSQPASMLLGVHLPTAI